MLKAQIQAARKEEKEQLEKDKNAASSDKQMQYTLEIRQVTTDILEKEYNISLKAKDIEKLQSTVKNVTVTSPVAGRVKAINENGGTDQNGNPLPFMTIVETSGFRVKGYVNENNAGTLTEGTAVVIRSRVSDQTWKGTISLIDWENAQQATRTGTMTAAAMTPPCPASTPSMWSWRAATGCCWGSMCTSSRTTVRTRSRTPTP